MVENEELPAWLQELRQQQLGDQPQEERPFTEELPAEIDQVDLASALQTQITQAEEQMAQLPEPAPTEEAAPSDLLDDLREQMLAEEDLEPYEQKPSFEFAQTILDLKPPQRLVLSILLFFNIALCGCMMLVVMGRVELPF